MATATRYLGTCPVCYREQKLHPDRQTRALEMVLHGYTRPGHGYVEGNCFGMGWAPFEVSPDGTIAYIERALQPMLERNQHFLQLLEAGKITELHVPDYTKPRGHTKIITPSDGYKFQDEIRSRIIATGSLIRQLTRDIAERTEMVRSWQEAPIRTEEEVLQKRARLTDDRRAVLDQARAVKQAKRDALDAKQRAREQEALDLIEEYRNIFEQLAFRASPTDRAEAKQHWVKMYKRMNKKGYLYFYPPRLQADEALARLGLAVEDSRRPGHMNYSNDMSWDPRP